MTTEPFHQKIHVKEVLGFLGALLHIPGIMAIVTLFVALSTSEYYAMLPLVGCALLSFGLGQLLYRLWYTPVSTHLWDAMLTAALAWFFCPLLASIPIYWIAHLSPSQYASMELGTFTNALFEAFSGFTTTGISLATTPSEYPLTLLFWRSFLQWVGGTGLVLFILILSQPSRSEHRLYFAEAREENIGETVVDTARIIWMIYSGYTLLCFGAYYFAGMSAWEALNHSMSTISTGGFTITGTSFASYNDSIKVVAIVFMLVGAISFAVHHKLLFKRSVKALCFDLQHCVFFGIILVGLALSYLVSFCSSVPMPFLTTLFNWISAVTTTGYSASSLIPYLPSIKLILLVGMLIGGPSGSTTGGIKVQRFAQLLEGVYVRMQSITDERERYIVTQGSLEKDGKPSFGLPMGEKAERLYAAGILLTMWMVALFVGWFVLLIAIPEQIALEAFFEVFSAMSNVGLTMGIINPSFPTFGKYVYMSLMWVGRLEVLPVLILLSSFLLKPDKASIEPNV